MATLPMFFKCLTGHSQELPTLARPSISSLQMCRSDVPMSGVLLVVPTIKPILKQSGLCIVAISRIKTTGVPHLWGNSLSQELNLTLQVYQNRLTTSRRNNDLNGN